MAAFLHKNYETMTDLLIAQDYNSTAVKIFLKNGKTKYGILLDYINQSYSDTWNFICNSNVNNFGETLNSKFIEVLPVESIESIDLYVK